MPTSVIVNSSPKVKVEIGTEPFLNNIFWIRLYAAVSENYFNVTANSGADPWGGGGSSDWDQLQMILTYCGISTPAQSFLAANSKEEVMKAIVKWITEKFIPAIIKAINDLLGKGTVSVTSGGNYKLPEEVLTDVLKSVKFTINADGSVSGSV